MSSTLINTIAEDNMDICIEHIGNWIQIAICILLHISHG